MGVIDPIPGTIASSSSFGIPTADEIQQYLEAGWTDWSSTFAWTASTTNPTLGTGSSVTALWRYKNAFEVQAYVYVQMGTTYNKGSGNYLFTVPVPAAFATRGAVSLLRFNDSGSATRWFGLLFADTTHLVAESLATGSIFNSGNLASILFATNNFGFCINYPTV